MTDIDFNLVSEWLKRILGHEGGYWDDPVGGPTRWGISKKAYPHLDIENLSIEAATVIYIRDYVSPLGLSRFPPGVAFQLLDFAVNSGPKTAIVQLQEAIGVEADGKVGPETIGKIEAMSASDIVMLFLAERLEFMTRLKNWKSNCTGWVLRIVGNLRYGAKDTD